MTEAPTTDCATLREHAERLDREVREWTPRQLRATYSCEQLAPELLERTKQKKPARPL